MRALMARIGPESFTETFGHLYTPENLAAFLVNHSEANWRGELEDPRFSVRIAEEDGVAAGFAKVGPPSLPFEVERADRGAAPALCAEALAGRRRRARADGLGDRRRRGGAARRSSSSRSSPTITAPRAFYARYGFEAVGTYAFMVGSHADEDIIMRLAL